MTKMTNVFGKIVCVVSILFLVWVGLSWADIVADNTSGNPHHSEYNLFVLMTKNYEQNKEQAEQLAQVEEVVVRDGACGNPVQDYIRVTCGWVTAVQGDGLSLEDEDGYTWYVEVGDGAQFSEGDYLCIFFDDMDTEDMFDDEVVKLWKEVW